jgi:NAD(P)-dependent dehydrogenase (short-subunit alcohol dehydrogenase family)
LRREIRRSGVSVSIVSPGYINTALTHHHRAGMPGPELIAGVIAGLVERPRREVVAPASYRAAIVVEQLAPWLVDRGLRR